LNEIVGPGRACLTQRWVEDREFFWVTSDLEAAGKMGEGMVRETVPFSPQMEGEAYRNSVESMEAVILTQGFNS